MSSLSPANSSPVNFPAAKAPAVNVVLSDRNWILERLGQELAVRLPGITLADAADARADINYYITFACRKAPAPTLEMGLFTHMEQLPELQTLFVETARALDLAVCMSQKYLDILAARGVSNTVLISPGVDLERFTPKLRIGVVGRAYHTGRKGEGLVAELMDMEGIDWHFTGTGWPEPGRFIPDAELPDFYRSMDYILVPALYEGGPMCVPEALAVGTPVIASDVGWVSAFPHIPFTTGDAGDLRRVLTDLLAQKRALRESTLGYSWDAYAEAHDRAFRDLMARASKAGQAGKPGKVSLLGRASQAGTQQDAPPPASSPVRLLLHGNERASQGGPSVRVPRTAETLNALGQPAQVDFFTPTSTAADISEPLVHVFNVWNPHSALRTLRHVRRAGKRVVLSPIYLDLSEHAYWSEVLKDLPLPGEPGGLDDIEAYRETYFAWRDHLGGRGRLSEPMPGYNAMVSEMLAMADQVVFLSEVERQGLARIGAPVEDARAQLVHNPVDAALWSGGDPDLFRETYLDALPGPRDYVLCVGRIERRKNQRMLARVLRDMDLRLVLVGHAGDTGYLKSVLAEAGPHVLNVGRLDPGSDMLRSALAGARIFALPSWSEGASLAALEAAAAGSNMVLSDRSSEREYFGDLAEYCDPGDPVSMACAIERALGADAVSQGTTRGARLAAHVAKAHSWETYATRTAAAYARALEGAPARDTAPEAAPQSAPDAEVKPASNPASNSGPNPDLKSGPKRAMRVITGGASPAAASAAAPDIRARPKVALDVTTLAHHQGRITGISRVEQMLAQELVKADVDLRFVFWQDSIKRFLEMPARFARVGQALRYNTRLNGAVGEPAVALEPGTVVIMGGSAWMQNERYVRGLDDLKSRCDARLLTVLYDLIPLKHEQWFEANYTPIFRRNFARLAAISDSYLVSSRNTREDLLEITRQLQPDRPADLPVDVEVLRLGDPVLLSDESLASRTGEDIAARFGGQKFVLAVGAIHARKNYEMLYRVWARFADEGVHGDLHLVIVGGVAWNGEALSRLIARDARVRGRIHVLSGIDDSTLGWLYDTCLFTAFPSFYEGWGLPVAESLVHGKLCLASNASSVAEIAPDVVEHIDPEDFARWHGKISFYASSPMARTLKEREIAERYAPVSWEQTCADIVARLARPISSAPPPLAVSGAPLAAGFQGTAGALRFREGWHAPETFGRWSAAPRAHVDVSLPAPDQAPDQERLVYLVLSLKLHQPSRRDARLVITVNGTPVFDARVHARRLPQDVVLAVPDSLLAGGVDAPGPETGESAGETTGIPCRIGFEFEPAFESRATHARRLGVGLMAVTVVDRAVSNILHALSRPELWADFGAPVFADLSHEAHRAALGVREQYSQAWGAGGSLGETRVFLPLLPADCAHRLTLRLRPVATRAHPVTAQILLNGERLLEEVFVSDDLEERVIDVPAGLLARAGPAVLEIASDGIMSPEELGLGVVSDISGIGLMAVSLAPQAEAGTKAETSGHHVDPSGAVA